MELRTLPALTVLSDNVSIVEKDNVKIVRVYTFYIPNRYSFVPLPVKKRHNQFNQIAI
jgi:hypothetical protein